jgi:hypothetical protein
LLEGFLGNETFPLRFGAGLVEADVEERLTVEPE